MLLEHPLAPPPDVAGQGRSRRSRARGKARPLRRPVREAVTILPSCSFAISEKLLRGRVEDFRNYLTENFSRNYAKVFARFTALILLCFAK